MALTYSVILCNLVSVAVLLDLSHFSNCLVIKILKPCAVMTVNTPKKQGHPINFHINTTDKTKPRGFVMRDWNSQNLDTYVGQLIDRIMNRVADNTFELFRRCHCWTQY